MQTERTRPVPFSEGLKSLPLLLLSLFVVVGAVDLLLAIQPGLLVALRGNWQDAMPSGSAVSTLLAAAIITGAIALSAVTLTWFVRSVRSAPYLCLAPLWVGLCMLVIGRMTVELPVPLPTPAFVAICALLFVGSGVLFETRSQTNNAVGAGLSALPVLVLILGYLLSSVPFDMSAMLLLLVLALAAAGAPVIAIACRANGTKLAGGREAASEDYSEQMVELLERAQRAERQLAALPAFGPGVTASPAPRLDDDELAFARRSGGAPAWITWAAAGVATAVLAAGYFLVYAPLSAEYTDHRVRTAKEAAALEHEMTVLRASAARDKQVLEQKLTAAYMARPPENSPDPGTGSAAAASAADSGEESEPEERKLTWRERREQRLAAEAAEADEEEEESSSERAEARKAARAERKAEWAAKKEAKKAERLAKREARLAARAERLEEREEEREAKAAEREAKRAEREAKREARAAERGGDDDEEAEEEEESPKPAAEPAPRDAMENDNDDPLEGLDGL